MLIYRYILKAHFAPFILSFFIVIFVFTFQFIMKYIDQLVGKGLSWWVISQLITLNLAWMVTLAGPMAALVAALMAFGSLSSSNEITVMQSSGISQFKLVLPVLIASGILCYCLIVFNNRVLPEANHRVRVLMTDIQRTRPSFVIEAGNFTNDIGGYNLLVRRTYENSNKLEGIFIIDNSGPIFSNTLTADSGQISFSRDNSKMIMELYSGEIHQIAKRNPVSDYRKIKFQKHIVNIDAAGFGFMMSDEKAFTRGDRELSADSMRSIIKKINSDFKIQSMSISLQTQNVIRDLSNFDYRSDGLDSVTLESRKLAARTMLNSLYAAKTAIVNKAKMEEGNLKQTNMYQVEIYKKYSIPFACIVFVLIGAPLGTITRRGGFGIAAGMSLGFFLLYWTFLIGGEKLADREFLSPFLSMWSANFLLGAAGLYLMFRQNIKNPISLDLTSWFSRIWRRR